ncbi:MAG: hypothetical protein QOE09_1209 [Ilumatobacteraceae bacterium]|jgi:lysophospholipase L1-like esterase
MKLFRKPPTHRPVRDGAIVITLSLLLVACSNATAGGNTSAVTATQVPGTSTPTSTNGHLTLLAIGDSIPFNSINDCPGCVGYVNQYQDAIAAATGKSVRVENLSRHTGLTSLGLLKDLDDAGVRASVAAADAITVSIGFNDSPMGLDDDPCDGAASDTQLALYTDACIGEWAAAFARRFTTVLDEIKQLRGDKPTLLTVINIYDQWLGFSENSADTNAHIAVVKGLLERQNAEICRIAADHGALCADLHSAFNGESHDRPSGTLLGLDYAHPSQAGNDLIAKTLEQLGFAPLA